MSSFLEDLTKFYGTGEVNKAGQSLEQFLEQYNPYKYKTPSCTTDAVVFSYKEELKKDLDGLKILLVKRSNHPSIGFWALPGGFVNIDENLDDTARRELVEETGVQNLAMEQFATYGEYDRDPRTRIITTAYMSLVKENQVKVQAGDDAADATWCEVSIQKNFEEQKEERIREEYELHFVNKEKGLDTKAKVFHMKKSGLINEEKFTVIDQGMIGSDHAAIIAQAMLILQNRL